MKLITTTLALTFAIGTVFAQDTKEKKEGYKFTIEKQLPATSVKDQHRSGTCWSFATISFLESELLRMGKGEYDLSEMFIVNRNYYLRAIDYVRYHGKKSFSAGAEGWDVLNVIKKYGIMPESVYTGVTFGEKLPVHGEMDAALKGYVDAVVKNKNRKLTPVWIKGFDAVLDAYLGEIPATFNYKGTEYTPKSFAKKLGINPDEYINITSFTHHPFYSSFVFEGADNWSLGKVYNVPMEEMMQIINNAINSGYSIGWGSDVSEKGFAFRKGVAVIPDTEVKNMDNAEISKWEKMSRKEKAAFGTEYPVKEKKITQEMRQIDFDNFTTTEDHMMHMIGTAKDQNGTKYYLIKNSWGTDLNNHKGYFYASETFVKYKTVSILVNKNAVPKSILKKFGL